MPDDPAPPATPRTDDAPRTGAPRPDAADAVGLFTRGFAMGMADVVPGVSGGTIAFISGVYERFIDALRSLSPAFLVSLARGRPRAAARDLLAIHWAVLVPMGLGIVLAILLMSRVITGLMDSHPGPTYAFFFGLILASAWVPLTRMRRRTWGHLVVALAAGAGAWLFVGARATGVELRVAAIEPDAVTVWYPGKLRAAADLETVKAAGEAAAPGLAGGLTFVVFDEKGVLDGVDTSGVFVLRTEEEAERWAADRAPSIILEEERSSLLYVFVCGAIAISAMILPGLSGSFLLLFLGQYHAVFTSIRACVDHVRRWLGAGGAAPPGVVHPWWQDFLFLGVFLCGVGLGLVVFSRVVAWLFRRAHDATMAFLTGLMLGALRLPAVYVLDDVPAGGDAPGYWLVVAGVAVAGGAIVTGLNLGDAWLRKRRAASSP